MRFDHWHGLGVRRILARQPSGFVRKEKIVFQRSFVAILVLLVLAGCVNKYTVPGGPAELSKLGLTDQDQVRRRTERDAFDQLLKQFKSEWPTVVATYQPK